MPKWWLGKFTMTKEAPAVLVLARYRTPGEAARVVSALSRQTQAHTRLVFVAPEDDESFGVITPTHEICRHEGLAHCLATSVADYLFYWPDEGDLHEAALEKLGLALHLATDQHGVTDSSRGANDLLLTRLDSGTLNFALCWLESKMKWLTEIQRRKLSFFFIAETLTREPHGSAGDFGAVENAFVRLPYLFENYQSISDEPVWPLNAEDADPRSVLFLVSSLPMGGACKFLLDVVAQLKANGHRVTVATTAYYTNDPNPWLGELLRIIPDVFVLSHARPVELPRLVAHLAHTRRCGRVVISHSMLGYQLLPWLRLQLPGVSFLDYTHIEYETEWPDGGYAQRSVNHQSLLDLAMVSSDHLRGWMIERGADGDKIRVCHTNIDTEKWKPDAETRTSERTALGLDAKTALILYPCRIAPQKRPELLCNIVAALRRATTAPFVVLVAGDGPLLPALRKFAEQHDLTAHVRLLGAVPLERVARLHNAADIFLLPSLIEGVALALFEAMALECVPVVSDVGGQRELVTATCGHLIPVGDPAREMTAYVATLKQLIENPAQRRRLAAASRARVEKEFPLARMTSRFIAAMDEAGTRRERQPVSMPHFTICHEIATLAIDHVRLMQQGGLARDYGHDMRELVTKRDKTIAKLQRQLDETRAQLQETRTYDAVC
jgi:glycosyltransferase involved in cell wall biosynthesis